MAERFYTNRPLDQGEVVLDGDEAHHLAAVSRHRPGDLVCLFNGDGATFPARVVAVRKREVILEVLGVESPPREVGFRLEVACAVPKGDRADFLVEKLTELGVTHLVPLRTSRGVVMPRDTKLDRLRRAVVEASKQCGRNVLMEVALLTDWREYLARPDLPARRFIAHTAGGAEFGEAGKGDIALAVGPEGGFTDEEVAAARAAGWKVVTLGPRTLRVETAALLLAGLAARPVPPT